MMGKSEAQEANAIFWKGQLWESYFLLYHKDISTCTCASCEGNTECEFGYDPYNSDGDCLMDK